MRTRCGRASRREMQLPQVLTGWAIAPSFPGDGASSPPATYGFGLFVDEHPALGRIVSHSGGYPGFGSNMAWHPATGTGVIALGNSTYAAMAPLAARLLEAVVRQGEPAAHGNGVALGSPGPWPETLAAQEAVSNLLQTWDDAEAQRLFSPNVALDAPFAERQRRIALVRERIGDFGDDPGRRPEFDTPAQCRWWLAGERGAVQVQIQLNPERPPRVQSLTLAVPPAAGSALRVTLDAVVDWLNDGDRDWPPSIPVADGVDTGMLARRLRMAAVWAGRCRVGAFKAGDGAASVAAELPGEHATHHPGPGHRPGNAPAPHGRRRAVALGRSRTRPFGPASSTAAGAREPDWADVTWITASRLRMPEIDSDTRPFRIDSTRYPEVLIVATRRQASTFPVPPQTSTGVRGVPRASTASDPERDTWIRRRFTVAAGSFSAC